jgi:hypothetical protein
MIDHIYQITYIMIFKLHQARATQWRSESLPASESKSESGPGGGPAGGGGCDPPPAAFPRRPLVPSPTVALQSWSSAGLSHESAGTVTRSLAHMGVTRVTVS